MDLPEPVFPMMAITTSLDDLTLDLDLCLAAPGGEGLKSGGWPGRDGVAGAGIVVSANPMEWNRSSSPRKGSILAPSSDDHAPGADPSNPLATFVAAALGSRQAAPESTAASPSSSSDSSAMLPMTLPGSLPLLAAAAAGGTALFSWKLLRQGTSGPPVQSVSTLEMVLTDAILPRPPRAGLTKVAEKVAYPVS